MNTKALIGSIGAVATVLLNASGAWCTAQDDLYKGIEYEKGAMTEWFYTDANPHLDTDMTMLQKDGIHWVSLEIPVQVKGWKSDYNTIMPALNSIASHNMWAQVNLLCASYDQNDEENRSNYKKWLAEAVKAWGNKAACFEVGGEENLSQSSEVGMGSNYPYGWKNLPDNKLSYANVDGGPCPKGAPPEWLTSEYEPCVRDFVVFLQDSYETIKKVNPKATVILGGVSSYHCSCYLTELAKFKAYNYADGIGFHPYDASPEVCSQDVSNWIQAVVDNWPRKLPIWITDWGWQCTNPQQPGWVPGPNGKNGSEEKRGEWYAQEYQLLRIQNKIKTPIFPYTAFDTKGIHAFGFISRNDQKQVTYWPVYYSYKDPLRGSSTK